MLFHEEVAVSAKLGLGSFCYLGVEGEYSEAPPLDARAIPNFGDKPEVKPEAEPRKRRGAHPDKTGDDEISGVNGYGDDDGA